MNEPKKRGRPAKAVIGTFPSQVAKGVEKLDPAEPVQVHRDPFEVRQAQAYANRVWAGQSPSLPHKERLRRVAAALESQGLSMEGVTL